MSEKNINREFIEAMMRLKRDTINFQKLNIIGELVIRLYGGVAITFNVKNNSWDILSEDLLNHKWNPTLDEIMEFLSKRVIANIATSIEMLSNQTIKGYSTINAISLESKFVQILGLMKLEENYNVVKPMSVFVNTKDNRALEIIYNPEKFAFTYNDGNTGNQSKLFLKHDLTDVLENSTYWEVFQSLNTIYYKLNRKI